MGASEFCYELKFTFGSYRFFWIRKKYQRFIAENNWNRLYIERKNRDGSFTIIRGAS